MRRFSIAVALAMLGQGALAQECPVRQDLETGIVFTSKDGQSETFVRMSGDLVLSEYRDGSSQFNALLRFGLYVASIYEIEGDTLVPDSRVVTIFPEGGFPAPFAGTEWTVEARRREASAGLFDLTTDVQHYAYGAPFEQDYGGCSYSVIPVEFSYVSNGAKIRETLHYIADLGVSYVFGFDEEGQAPATYPYHSVARLN